MEIRCANGELRISEEWKLTQIGLSKIAVMLDWAVLIFLSDCELEVR